MLGIVLHQCQLSELVGGVVHIFYIFCTLVKNFYFGLQLVCAAVRGLSLVVARGATG